MMTRKQYLLLKLAEEAAEISQIALKAAQFGLDDVWEKVAPLTVRDRIHGELDDLCGIYTLLNAEAGLAYVPNEARINAKIEKVNRYYALSVRLGEVADVPLQNPLAQSAVNWGCSTPFCNFSVAAEAFVGGGVCPWCRASYSTFVPIPF